MFPCQLADAIVGGIDRRDSVQVFAAAVSAIIPEARCSWTNFLQSRLAAQTRMRPYTLTPTSRLRQSLPFSA